nr:uncharacterized protein LOC100182204 [Ciona intestinalis]|eukprot:XP_002130487.1 uncharacterized protein LOC100182204 [Ciona intestinalis]
MRRNCILKLLLGLTVFGNTHGVLYPYGPENGDGIADCGRWNLGSVKIPLNDPIPFFGGPPLADVWISTFGALSPNKIKDHRVNQILNNTILAPFFVSSQPGGEGIIHHRQVCGNDPLLMQISIDVARSRNVPNVNFAPNCALVVTWSKVSSLDDSDQTNTFQAVIASDGEKSYAIYNYPRNITWITGNNRPAVAGVFVSGDLMSSCEVHLPGSETPMVQNLGTNTWVNGVRGRYVLDISSPLKCSSKFISPCGNLTEDRGTSEGYFQYTEDGTGRFFRRFTCNVGFYLSPDTNTRDVDCVYDPDYYTYEWEELPNGCLDLNATRRLQTSLEVSRFNNTDLLSWYDDPTTLQTLLQDYLPESINHLVEVAGIRGVVNNVDSISNLTRDGNTASVNVNFTTYVPTYNNKRLNGDKLGQEIENALRNDGQVDLVSYNPSANTTEIVNECLQSCLCWMNYDPVRCKAGKIKPDILPDACCGCPGQAYTSSLKACCNNRQIYDPTKSVCCGRHVRQGSSCPPSRKFRK